MTHTIEIPIPDDLLHQIDLQAQRAGVDRGEYIRAVLSRGLNPSLSDVLAPFRADVAASGITDEELERLFSSARDEVRRQK